MQSPLHPQQKEERKPGRPPWQIEPVRDQADLESDDYPEPAGPLAHEKNHSRTDPEQHIEVPEHRVGILADQQTPDIRQSVRFECVTGKNQLHRHIQNANHKRDRSSAIDNIQADLDERLLYLATDFLESVRTEKHRYARDQFRIIQTLIDKYDVDACLDAIEFCSRSRIFSANTMKDYLEHQESASSHPLPELDLSRIPVSNAKYHISTEKRPLDVYVKVGDRNADTY